MLNEYTIESAGKAIRKKEFSVLEIVRACRAAIAEKDHEIRAYLEVFGDAEVEAKKRDEEIAGMDPDERDRLPLLFGIPLAIKDNILIEGKRASAGSRMLEGYVAPYEAGSRGFHWIKIKANTAALGRLRAADRTGAGVDGVALPDTIDCVLMGAYRGRGKRAKFGAGGFLLGVRGAGDQYYTISRLGTGLSDEQFREVSRRMQKEKVAEKPKEYAADSDGAPDIWLKPSLVVEILADEITRSPRQTAGRDADGKGYSLRFPRLVRFRDDKSAEDATTVQEIKRMRQRQKKR